MQTSKARMEWQRCDRVRSGLDCMNIGVLLLPKMRESTGRAELSTRSTTQLKMMCVIGVSLRRGIILEQQRRL